jgi:hypothetical protein
MPADALDRSSTKNQKSSSKKRLVLSAFYHTTCAVGLLGVDLTYNICFQDPQFPLQEDFQGTVSCK